MYLLVALCLCQVGLVGFLGCREDLLDVVKYLVGVHLHGSAVFGQMIYIGVILHPHSLNLIYDLIVCHHLQSFFFFLVCCFIGSINRWSKVLVLHSVIICIAMFSVPRAIAFVRIILHIFLYSFTWTKNAGRSYSSGRWNWWWGGWCSGRVTPDSPSIRVRQLFHLVTKLLPRHPNIHPIFKAPCKEQRQDNNTNLFAWFFKYRISLVGIIFGYIGRRGLTIMNILIFLFSTWMYSPAQHDHNIRYSTCC